MAKPWGNHRHYRTGLMRGVHQIPDFFRQNPWVCVGVLALTLGVVFAPVFLATTLINFVAWTASTLINLAVFAIAAVIVVFSIYAISPSRDSLGDDLQSYKTSFNRLKDPLESLSKEPLLNSKNEESFVATPTIDSAKLARKPHVGLHFYPTKPVAVCIEANEYDDTALSVSTLH